MRSNSVCEVADVTGVLFSPSGKAILPIALLFKVNAVGRKRNKKIGYNIDQLLNWQITEWGQGKPN